MKTKTLIYILSLLLILLAYNMFCYWFVNHILEKNTQYIINDYLKTSCNHCEYEYDLKKAISNSDQSLSIYIKVKNKSQELEEYYHFKIEQVGNSYGLISVDTNIPAYIK